MDEIVENHRQEIRRGTVVLASLALLTEPGHGYGLLDALASRGFAVDANTLYPLLRRLEKQGFLTSEWNTEDSRPRKFYVISADGARLADTLSTEWHDLTRSIASLTDDPGTPEEN